MLESLRFSCVHRLPHLALLAALSVLFIPLQPAAGAAAMHHHFKLIVIGSFPGLSIYNTPVTSNGGAALLNSSRF